jgi:hypothetical protein
MSTAVATGIVFKQTKGTRLDDKSEPVADRYAQFVLPKEFFASYFRDSHDVWTCVTPNGRLVNLAAHRVTENRDGTITVSSPISAPKVVGLSFDERERAEIARKGGEKHVKMHEAGAPGWYGYIDAGVFSEEPRRELPKGIE